MGGCTFMNRGKGASAKEAFDALVSDARYQHGHGGYTGTIAEKSSFVMIDVGCPPGAEDPVRWRTDQAQRLLEVGDRRIDDKWGPAGCVQLDSNEFLFFGWASE